MKITEGIYKEIEFPLSFTFENGIKLDLDYRRNSLYDSCEFIPTLRFPGFVMTSELINSSKMNFKDLYELELRLMIIKLQTELDKILNKKIQNETNN